MAEKSSSQYFLERLTEIKAKIQAASTTLEGSNTLEGEAEGEAALKLWEEMKETIACLSKIAKSIEESNEVKAAKVAKATSAKRKRTEVLEDAIRDAKEGVEKLLGYLPDYSKGLRYDMLPKGYMDRSNYLAEMKRYQACIDETKEKTYVGKDGLRYDPSVSVATHKAALTRFMMLNKPMDAKAFHAKLHPQLDALHEALKELRTLEASEPDA